jgi:thiol-disulfide isomerase/thioredoxin
MARLEVFPNEPVRPGGNGCFVLLLLALGLVIAVGVLVGLAVKVFLPLWQEGRAGKDHPAVGQRLATIELVPLTGDGQPVRAADLAGKVVVLNFWGTWCPPCIQELPHIAALEKHYRGRDDFRLLAVSCGRGLGEDRDALRRETANLLAQKGLDLPTYADPGQATRAAVNEAGGFGGYPTTLVLDRRGTIRGGFTGYAPGVELQLERLVEKLLAE